ncbi:MAG: hypothetical protein R2780_06715 [Crocinitomicaceae bacterium]|nr:hypothetical protein [Crocinitomicaceae bacterium]
MIKTKGIISIIFLGIGILNWGQSKFDKHLLEVTLEGTGEQVHFVKTPDLFDERWDTLPQPNFWRHVMEMPPDSGIMNIWETREILEYVWIKDWNKLSEDDKDDYRQSLRNKFNLDSNTRIVMTTGKSDFFQFEKVFPSISRGVELFIEYDTDPWYAQAILMIESPGKLAYSNVGALGPFQLMKTVARNHGLTVNKYVDERKDFDRSAYGSSHLIRTSCIPEAKRILNKFGITVRGDDEYKLWFRLLVLHIYHAGAGNVDGLLVNVVKPKQGGQGFIKTIWHSQYGNFGNSSQNYSQLALASLLVLDDLIHVKCSAMEDCHYEN